MKHSISYSILCILVTLTGCSFGPKYVPPTASVPTSWSEGREHSRPAVSDDEAWWRNFHDPILNNLIEQHSVYNLDLQVAQARIATAQAEYAVAVGQFFPVVNLAGLPPSGTGVTINQLIALTTSIEPDLFGRIRQSKKSAQANADANQADRNFTLINIYADIATSYIELRAAQAKNAILTRNLQASKQILQFAQSRYNVGNTKYTDIAQQNSLIEKQLAEIEQNKALIIATLHKIELLTGNNPGVLAKQLLPVKPIPRITQTIDLGIPSELLRRRPDIVAAEQRVVAAHANIKIAIANLFPQINIGWLFGWQTQTLASNLFAISNPASSLFATFDASIFNLASYRVIDVRKRQKIVALLQYQLTVMKALHEVEIQYNYCKHYGASEKHLRHATDKKQVVLNLFKNSYEKGAFDFGAVLLAEQELNGLQDSYIKNVVMHQVAKINLYKALGGGVILPKEISAAADHKKTS